MGGIHVKHETKKRFSKAKTSRKKIEGGISAEFTDYRQKLTLVSASLKTLVKQIRSSSQVWSGVTNHQRSFAESLVAAIPAEGLVRQHASEVETTVRGMERTILQGNTAASYNRLVTVLDDYLALIAGVEKEYPEAESSFSEVLRYQRKVDRLAKNGKKQEQHTRNVEKLHSTRAQHDDRIRALVDRMREVYNKHEAVFQCAHHAFWIAQDAFGQTVNEATRMIRWESSATKDQLLSIDVANSPTLPPVPRVPLIIAPTENATGDPTIDAPTAPIPEAQTEYTKPQVTVISSTTVPPPSTEVAPTAPNKADVITQTPHLPTPPVQTPPPPPTVVVEEAKVNVQQHEKPSIRERLFGKTKEPTETVATPQPA